MTKIRIPRIELICQLLNEGKSRKEIQLATGLKESSLRWYIYTYLEVENPVKYKVKDEAYKQVPREC